MQPRKVNERHSRITFAGPRRGFRGGLPLQLGFMSTNDALQGLVKMLAARFTEAVNPSICHGGVELRSQVESVGIGLSRPVMLLVCLEGGVFLEDKPPAVSVLGLP